MRSVGSHPRWRLCGRAAVAVIVWLAGSAAGAAPPRPPSDLVVADHPWDRGNALDVRFRLSPDEPPGEGESPIAAYLISRCAEPDGLYVEMLRVTPSPEERAAGEMTVTVSDVAIAPGRPWHVRVTAVTAEGEESDFVQTPPDAPAESRRQLFDGRRGWLLLIGSVIAGAVVWFIAMARSGRTLYVRKIAGLEAVEEAVGRATEMGRACLFVPGILDINDIQTIAGLTILSRVASRAAEYDARLDVPTSKSLVMTAARETVQAAYLAAGRPDAYNEDAITYVTDEQFGYVAYLTGAMTRDKPAACFYLGGFFAESLILAETGNAIGAIQVAGTAQPAQLPFFVAACDYTLIGEEFFAASAYLSRDPDQLGSLKGQDVGKFIVAALMLIGVGLLTAGNVATSLPAAGLAEWGEWALAAGNYLRDVILASG